MILDDIDRQLINILQEDAKKSIKEIATELNLSITPIYERIKKIEKSGLIKRYVAIVDLSRVNKSLINFCSVSIVKHNDDLFSDFAQQVKAMDEVLECYYVSGDFDFLLKIATANIDEYQNFVFNKLSKIKIVSNISSQFAMKHVKFKTSVRI